MIVCCFVYVEPQSPPGEVRLTAISSECVELTWIPPIYSGGHILKYQVESYNVNTVLSILRTLNLWVW